MSKVFIEESTLTGIANAIREKSGETSLINVTDMSTKIQNLEDTSSDIIGRKVSEINNDKATAIGNYAFYSYTSLVGVNFPACTSIGSNAFHGCTSLSDINFPACTSIGKKAFFGCESLTHVDFPVYTGAMMDDAFASCDNIAEARFSSLSCVGMQLFYHCDGLMSFTNTYSKVASMPYSNAFDMTPMALSNITGSFGSIYVPASLVNAYKNATNWAYYADRITAIPE